MANQGGSCKLQGVREKHTVSCLSFSFSRNIGAQVCHIQKSNKVNVNVVLELEKNQESRWSSGNLVTVWLLIFPRVCNLQMDSLFVLCR